MYLSFNVTFQLNQKELTAFLSKILSKSSHKPTLRKISCVMQYSSGKGFTLYDKW